LRPPDSPSDAAVLPSITPLSKEIVTCDSPV
jgi:hypothetical protein